MTNDEKDARVDDSQYGAPLATASENETAPATVPPNQVSNGPTVGRITFAPTPGPWKALKSRGLNSYEVQGAAGQDLADVWGADNPVPNGVKSTEVKANARLIAAAPDLLVALKALRCAYCGYFIGMLDRERPCATCESARAAIAKAEGRA